MSSMRFDDRCVDGVVRGLGDVSCWTLSAQMLLRDGGFSRLSQKFNFVFRNISPLILCLSMIRMSAARHNSSIQYVSLCVNTLWQVIARLRCGRASISIPKEKNQKYINYFLRVRSSIHNGGVVNALDLNFSLFSHLIPSGAQVQILLVEFLKKNFFGKKLLLKKNKENPLFCKHSDSRMENFVQIKTTMNNLDLQSMKARFSYKRA